MFAVLKPKNNKKSYKKSNISKAFIRIFLRTKQVLDNSILILLPVVY